MKNILAYLLIIAMATTHNLVAQRREINKPQNKTAEKSTENTGKFDKEKLVIEPNISGSFGSGSGFSSGFFQFSPMIGYRITDKFVPSAGPSYNFIASNGYSLHQLGASARARYYPFNSLFVTGQYQYLRALGNSLLSDSYRNVNRFPIGAGYHQRIGSGGAYIELLYDILYKKDKSLYGSPLIYQVGVTF